MAKKKRIGIPGWNVGETTFGVSKPYLEFIKRFGTPIILYPHLEVEDIDLLLLPGGKDVSPMRYGEWPDRLTSDANLMLEAFDLMMLQKYIDADIPIVGICRGMQTLYVHFGGKLTQHMEHETSKYPTEEVHLFCGKTEFSDFLNEDVDGVLKPLVKGKVNSRHHQCIDPTTCPEEIEILGHYAYVSNKKLYYVEAHPEAFKHKTKNIFAVQWHPEDCENDHLTPKVIRQFLNIN